MQASLIIWCIAIAFFTLGGLVLFALWTIKADLAEQTSALYAALAEQERQIQGRLSEMQRASRIIERAWSERGERAPW